MCYKHCMWSVTSSTGHGNDLMTTRTRTRTRRRRRKKKRKKKVQDEHEHNGARPPLSTLQHPRMKRKGRRRRRTEASLEKKLGRGCSLFEGLRGGADGSAMSY